MSFSASCVKVNGHEDREQSSESAELDETRQNQPHRVLCVTGYMNLGMYKQVVMYPYIH